MPTIESIPQIPHIEQYSGVWAMEQEAMEKFLGRLRLAEADAGATDDRTTAGVRREGAVAVIDINGPLTKYPNFMQQLLGGTAMMDAMIAVNAAAADDSIESILLNIDSPGGTVSGTSDLADAVFAARSSKRVVAHISDMGASAAYWIASQAHRISANKTALVGSIGTYAVVSDWSKFYEDAGVKVHVIRAGEFKGAGTAGTKVTEDQIAEFQRVIDDVNRSFLEAVHRGRKGMDAKTVQTLADGRVHVGVEARKLGLIDAIDTLGGAIAGLFGQTITGKGRPSVAAAHLKQETVMSNEETAANAAERKAATLAELKAAMPESDAEFREKCLLANATLEDAKGMWIARMREENAKLAEASEKQAKDIAAKEREIEELKAQAKSPGVKPLATEESGSASADTGDPIATWDAAVDEKIKAGMNKQRAIAAVVKAQPELREAYVQAYNDLKKAG